MVERYRKFVTWNFLGNSGFNSHTDCIYIRHAISLVHISLQIQPSKQKTTSTPPSLESNSPAWGILRGYSTVIIFVGTLYKLVYHTEGKISHFSFPIFDFMPPCTHRSDYSWYGNSWIWLSILIPRAQNLLSSQAQHTVVGWT